MIDNYRVFVKINDNGCIIAVNSSAFLSAFDGWQEIDNGVGDKYHHAQGNYFEKPLLDDRGLFNYKLINGKPQERTEAEKEVDFMPPVIIPSIDERVTELEAAFTLLLQGAIE